MAGVEHGQHIDKQVIDPVVNQVGIVFDQCRPYIDSVANLIDKRLCSQQVQHLMESINEVHPQARLLRFVVVISFLQCRETRERILIV